MSPGTARDGAGGNCHVVGLHRTVGWPLVTGVPPCLSRRVVCSIGAGRDSSGRSGSWLGRIITMSSPSERNGPARTGGGWLSSCSWLVMNVTFGWEEITYIVICLVTTGLATKLFYQVGLSEPITHNRQLMIPCIINVEPIQ